MIIHVHIQSVRNTAELIFQRTRIDNRWLQSWQPLNVDGREWIMAAQRSAGLFLTIRCILRTANKVIRVKRSRDR